MVKSFFIYVVFGTVDAHRLVTIFLFLRRNILLQLGLIFLSCLPFFPLELVDRIFPQEGVMFWFTSSWSAALAVCIVLATSQAHTVMTTLFVDGVNQGDGVCIRMNSNGSTSNFFVSSVSSKDIACGKEEKSFPDSYVRYSIDKQKEWKGKLVPRGSVQPNPLQS